ncbi:hypothetical protein BT69DRAFT_1348384 [Atractiella rhizophila]|nr:hypothetical protein BT69DRAFT_1348384 [Atractiella rhizophila]
MAPTNEDLRLYALYCFDVLHSRLTSSTSPSPRSLPGYKDEYPLFVTWNITSSTSRSVRLRGCIGNFEKLRLGDGLAEYAIISAFKDRRFNPITSRELSRLECGISLLTKFEPASNYLDWTIGVHGIYISFPNPELRGYPVSSTSEGEEEEDDPISENDLTSEGEIEVDDTEEETTIPVLMPTVLEKQVDTPGSGSGSSSTATPSSSSDLFSPPDAGSTTSLNTPTLTRPPSTDSSSRASGSKVKSPSLLRSHLSSLLKSQSHKTQTQTQSQSKVKSPSTPVLPPPQEEKEYSLSDLLPHGYGNLSATYLPDVAKEQEWTKIETLDSLMRKAGWDGEITERMRRGVKVVRYQCLKGGVAYGEWKRWRGEMGKSV